MLKRPTFFRNWFRQAVCVLSISILTAPALLADGKQESPAPVIRRIEVAADEVRLEIDFRIPWAWENFRFRTRKTFPGFLPGTFTRHQLTFGHFEEGIAEWFITDFIMIGDYQILDPDTVQADFSTGSIEIGTYNREQHVLVFDGLEYDPYLSPPDFRILKSHDLIRWEVIDSSALSTPAPIWPAPVVVTVSGSVGQTFFFKVECL